MPPERLPEDFPAFVDTNTLDDMAALAKKVVLVQEFAKAIVKSENDLLSGGGGKGDFSLVAGYALEAAKYAGQAASILKSVKHKAREYEGMVRNVAG